MQKLLLTICVSFLCFRSLFCEVIETKHMEQILPYIDNETLVAFDIDNTLIIPKQMLGSDKWFSNTLNKYLSEGCLISEALAKILPVYMEIQNRTDVAVIEESVPYLIHNLQKQGVKIIGVTSRSSELAYKTYEQLASVDIHLDKNSIESDLKLSTHFPLNYIKGILFTSQKHKGECLFKLANELNHPIKKIVFVDDKLIYLEQLEEICAYNRIPYVGFRYGGADEFVNSFNDEIALVQLKYFEHILSNDDADLLIQKNIGESFESPSSISRFY